MDISGRVPPLTWEVKERRTRIMVAALGTVFLGLLGALVFLAISYLRSSFVELE